MAVIQELKAIYPYQWEDVRVPVSATLYNASTSPVLGLFRNDGVAGPAGSAVSLDGTNDYLVTGADYGDFGASWSTTFWINTSYTGAPIRYIVYKDASFSIGVVSSSKIRLSLQGKTAVTTTVPLLVGAWNHVVVTVDSGVAATVVEIFINGTSVTSVSLPGSLAAGNSNLVYWGATSGLTSNLQMLLDEARVYQAVLSDADVAELYAAGAGTESEPTSAPTLLAGYHFNDGSGTNADNYQGTANRDLTLTNGPTWVAGKVGSSGSRGVHTYLFRHGFDDELYFSLQLPHSYAEGTNLHPHLHWSPMSTSGGNVVWGIEYSLVSIDGTFPNTTLSTLTEAAGSTAYKHIMSEFATISGTGITVSAMFTGRIYRNGTSGSDTYIDACAFHDFDLHVQMNSVGSVSELTKL